MMNIIFEGLPYSFVISLTPDDKKLSQLSQSFANPCSTDIAYIVTC